MSYDPSGDRLYDDDQPNRSRSSAAAPRHRRHRPWVRRVLIVLASLLVFTLVGGFFVYRKLTGNIQGIDMGPGHGGSTDNAPMNILLLGSDTRVNQGKLSDKTKVGARSDTAILLHLSAKRDYAIAASIPRDSVVPFPECQDTDPQTSATVSPASSHKMFNEAFSIGGPVCTAKVVEKNTGVAVDHFAVVDFSGFKNMVNALGGVKICVPKPIKDDKSHLDIPGGTQVLDGDQSLAFVRTRKAVGNGSDIGRIKLQQAFLSAMVRQATDAKLLLQPGKLYNFLNATTKSLTMDTELASRVNSPLGATGLAKEVSGIKPANLHFITVPTEPYPTNHNRVQWSSGADDIWQAIRDDTPLPGTKAADGSTPSSTTGTTVDPSGVEVQVINRSGVKGLARQASAALKAQGFITDTPTTEAVSSARGVVVRYPEGMKEAANTVAAAFPGAKVKLDSSLTGQTVVAELGAGTPSVVAVPSAASTELPEQPIKAKVPSSTKSPSASVAGQNAAEDSLCK